MSDPVSVDVTYRGLPVARAVRMVTAEGGPGGFVEMDSPMPVGTELVLSPTVGGSPGSAGRGGVAPLEDADGILVKVARVVESSDPAVRAGAQVVVLGKTARVQLPALSEEDVAAAQARAAVPVPAAPSSSAPQLAAALAAASTPTAAPEPARVTAEVVVPRVPEPSVVVAEPSVVVAAEPSPDLTTTGEQATVDLKSLEEGGDDKKKGGKGRKRKNTMIGR